MPYLTADDYVTRFSEPEAIRITDTARTGAPNFATIEEAIADQSLFADAFLSGRYRLPINPAPELLRKAVADLAREQLHSTRPTQAVTDNADRARALLKDLSAGRANIPAPAAGEAPAETPGDLPAVSNDHRPRVFSDAALNDFTSLGANRYGGTVFDGPAGW